MGVNIAAFSLTWAEFVSDGRDGNRRGNIHRMKLALSLTLLEKLNLSTTAQYHRLID